MIAVVKLGGSQFTVKVWDLLDVDNQNKEVWAVFDTMALLLSDLDGNNVKVWTPYVDNSKIEFRVVDNFKGDKIRVFKMKSKKRYARTKWFRPEHTQLEVLNIS
jgi:large subunit ribosomal protein L21